MLKKIGRIPLKYRRMVLFSTVIVTLMAISHCRGHNYEFVDYLYIVPFGTVMGFLSGIVIALISWLGVKVGIWTLSDT